MKITALTILFLLLNTFCFSQTNKRDLIRVWKSKSESLSQTDTIKFYPNISGCFQTHWKIEKRRFRTEKINYCTEPPIVTIVAGKEKIKLKEKDFGQIIEYYQNGILTNKFRIIEFKKENLPELKLMPFDELSEQKVYKYVDSIIVKVLKFNPEMKDKIIEETQIDDPNILKIKYVNLEPLTVVNGYPLTDREPLRKLYLAETTIIKYLKKEQAEMIYGSRAMNGVVILETSQKRLKKVLKKYSR